MLVARVIETQGIRNVFTLTGGHISPILTSCRSLGIRVVDTRHEAYAVFVSNSHSRILGIPGVVIVTAGSGVTNSVTAIKNVAFTQSPLVLIGGATATLLRGRGALQDINQLELMRPHVKRVLRVTSMNRIVGTLKEAFQTAASGVPGPVFLEFPVDLLFPQDLITKWYLEASGVGKTWKSFLYRFYLKRYINRLFRISKKRILYDRELKTSAD